MGKYDDIIHLPHYQSSRRAHMSLDARAAQFAPFAALTGYGAAVEETARLTDSRTELADGKKEELNALLQEIVSRIGERPKVKATFFVPDERKSGGAYVAAEGNVLRVDAITQSIVFTDGTVVPMAELFDLQISET